MRGPVFGDIMSLTKQCSWCVMDVVKKVSWVSLILPHPEFAAYRRRELVLVVPSAAAGRQKDGVLLTRQHDVPPCDGLVGEKLDRVVRDKCEVRVELDNFCRDLFLEGPDRG
jgi:hypothetical protein